MHRLLDIEQYKKIFWNSPEKDQDLYQQDRHPIRWFLLLWVSLVSLWGSAQLFAGDYVQLPPVGFVLIRSWHISPPMPFLASSPLPEHLSLLPDHTSSPFSIIGIILLAAQVFLHWLSLWSRVPQRWYWSYFLVQGGCVCVLSFIWTDPIIVFGFYLVLIIEVLSMLRSVRQILLIVTGYLIVFMLTMLWQITHLLIWMTLESVLLLIIFLIGWVILSIQRLYAHSQLESAHQQLAAYAMRVEELTLLNERQRLARELHDTLAQDLVGLTLQLERIDQHLEKQRVERARELAQQAMARARATLAEARHAIDDLRAHTRIPGGLLLAVEREIARFRDTTSIICVAQLGALENVPEQLYEHVLRAITEGLTNVARHSRAHQVWLEICLHETLLVIEVRDDGTGFESALLAKQKGHYGLVGLRERARLCGGKLDLECAVGKGTVLRLSLPLTKRGALE